MKSMNASRRPSMSQDSKGLILAILLIVWLQLAVNHTAAQTNALGPQPGTAPLQGIVDLHTHPMANLGFAGKLLHGGLDVGSLLPADANCNHNVRATSVEQALGSCNPTHGGWGLDNPCGDVIRNLVINQTQSNQKPAASGCGSRNGYPSFDSWPANNDITHQCMWVDWIRRTYLGGLRVMVALAVNNKTLADMVAGPGDGPDDDKTSADLQICELKMFVARHSISSAPVGDVSNFMEVAYSSADLERIVRANKLAVILGTEIDHIGNFGDITVPGYVPTNQLSDAIIQNEIDRLYGEGVRYIFPIHMLDNAFGGASAYQDLMNYSNYRESGNWWNLMAVTNFTYNFSSQSGLEFDAGILAKLGNVIFAPPTYPNVTGFTTNAGQIVTGLANVQGLTSQGKVAIKEMMRLGVMIDIDHMSDLAKQQTIDLAQTVGYPLNSGHSSLRIFGGASVNERSTSTNQYQAIVKLHGMAGVGDAGSDAYAWANAYANVISVMGGWSSAACGFGTDADGVSPLFKQRTNSAVLYNASFPRCTLGTKTWDYNTNGVAHYGLLPDFLQDVQTDTNDGGPLIYSNLMSGANYLLQTWKICEAGGTL